MKMMPKPFGFAGWWTSRRSAVPEYMPYTTLRSTRAWALAASHTPRRRTAKTSRGSRRWIFMSVAPSLDALLGAAIGSGGRDHGGSIAPSQYGLKRVISCGGSGTGRRVLRVDVHPGPLARAEDRGDAAIRRHLVLIGALDLLGGEGEHSARDRVGRAPRESHDRMVLLPAQGHGGLVETGQHVTLTGQAPAEGGQLHRLELQRPVREEKLFLVHVDPVAQRA